jgi:hypothetical protein
MLIRKIASALVITSLFYSCGSPKEEEKDYTSSIQVDNANLSDSVDISDYIDTVQIIQLNETKGNYLSIIDKLYPVKDHYIAADIHQTHRINLFNKNGDFVKTIIKQGQGPDEVLQLNDCWLNEQGELEVYDYAMKKIFLFDTAYTLKTITKGEDFCILNAMENIPHSSLYVGYAGFSGIDPASAGDPFQIVILDKNLKMLSKHLRYKSKFTRIMWLSYREHFSAYGDSLRFIKSYDNHVYDIGPSGINKRYKIFYTDNAASPDERNKYLAAYTTLSTTWLENDSLAYFLSKTGSQFLFASFFNKTTGQVESAKVFTAAKKYQMNLPFFKTYDAAGQEFIAIVNGSWLKKKALSNRSIFYHKVADDPSIQYLVKIKLKL